MVNFHLEVNGVRLAATFKKVLKNTTEWGEYIDIICNFAKI